MLLSQSFASLLTNADASGPHLGQTPSKTDLAKAKNIAELQAASGQRAFGFSELGPLGRPGLTSSQPTPDPLARPQDGQPDGSAIPGAGGAPAMDDVHARLMGQPTARHGVTTAGETGTPTKSQTLAAASLISVTALESSAPIAGVEWGGDGATSFSPDGPTAAPKMDQIRQQARQSDLSVIISEQNGSIEIIMAAAGITPQSGIHLRQIAGELLTEHGIGLSDFFVNGRYIKSEVVPIGGVHGDRGH